MVSTPSLPPSRAGSITLLGGALALDFANTESGRGHSSHQDHLQAPQNVAEWLGHARALAPTEAQWLAAEAGGRETLGEALLRRARALRDDIYACSLAVARKGSPSTGALERLNAYHGRCLACAELKREGRHFHWRWDIRTEPVEAALAPIAMSAISILTTFELARVKECDGEHCGWLFYDCTKNNSRRWCEMEICGNRAKQRRLRARRTPE